MHLQRNGVVVGGADTQRLGLNEEAALLTIDQQRPKPDRSSWKCGTLSGHCRQFCFWGTEPHLGNICWNNTADYSVCVYVCGDRNKDVLLSSGGL